MLSQMNPILLTHLRARWNMGHFTFEPRAVTMKFREPKRNCAKVVPRHLQNHRVWSWTFKYSVKSYVTGPSTKCYFNECLFMWVRTLDLIEYQQLSVFGMPWSPGFYVKPTSKKLIFLKIVQVTMKHDPFDAMYGIHVDFTSIVHSHTYSVGPSSIVWRKRTWTTGSAFSTKESAWSEMVSRALSLVCEVALTTPCNHVGIQYHTCMANSTENKSFCEVPKYVINTRPHCPKLINYTCPKLHYWKLYSNYWYTTAQSWLKYCCKCIMTFQ